MIEREDVREYIFVILVLVAVFMVYMNTGINPILHENGHQWVCHNIGGQYTVTEEAHGHITKCNGLTISNIPTFSYLIFVLGGLLMELVVGVGIIFVPILAGYITGKVAPTGFVSFFGGLIVAKTGLNLYSGAYGVDLSNASKFFPSIYFLQTDLGIGIYLVFCVLVLCFTAEHTLDLTRKLDISFV